jgi:NTP pyrophosphatase (non-canonical NTP hydrolase)
MDFTVLRDANVRRQQEWDRQGKIDIAYRGNELAGECGEACNIIKKIERERRGIRGSRATLRQLADELADVIICVDLIALYEDIDVWESVKRKFNETSRNNNLDTTL